MRLGVPEVVKEVREEVRAYGDGDDTADVLERSL